MYSMKVICITALIPALLCGFKMNIGKIDILYVFCLLYSLYSSSLSDGLGVSFIEDVPFRFSLLSVS